MTATLSRRLILTDSGEVGLSPADTQRGDMIYHVAGGVTPLILRKDFHRGCDHYKLVGDCYLLGMNDTEPTPRLLYNIIHIV